jgi:selT/selW/selH-like putative selenoprotein
MLTDFKNERWRRGMLAKYLIILPLLLIVSISVHAQDSEGNNPSNNQGNINIEIHHCTTCGFQTKANMLAEEIHNEFGIEADLIIGDIGSFDVFINGHQIFSKAEAGRFPNPDEIIQKIIEYKNNNNLLSNQED